MSSGGGNTHWCHQCQQPVRLHGQAMVCPRCDGGFVEELDELGGGGSGGGGGGYGSYGYRDGHGPDELLGIMDALESLMLRNSPEHRLRLMEALMSQRRRHGVGSEPRNYDPDHAFALLEPLEALRRQRIRRRYGVDSEHPSPWLIFQGQMPARAPRSGGGLEMILNGNPRVGFTRGNSDDFFVGPGLQDLVEELMERLVTDRQGPPPAPRSAIDAMPTIKMTQAHLQTDSHCPVCKDQFEPGTEARRMPCNHIYHSDCIVPWLVQHNSCPVCRHVMGSTPPNRRQSPSTVSRSGSSNTRGTESSEQNSSRRNPFSFLWPFRSSSTNSSREYAGTGSSTPTPATTTAAAAAPHEENHEMNYSGWPFDY